MSMHASPNSCVDRLNTEGGRDPASRLTQIADKRREQVTPEKTDEEKAGKVEKMEERYRSTHSAQPANGRDENLSV